MAIVARLLPLRAASRRYKADKYQHPNRSTLHVPLPSQASLRRAGSLPTQSVSRFLSRVTICGTLATESFGNPVRRADKRRFPGAPSPTSDCQSEGHTGATTNQQPHQHSVGFSGTLDKNSLPNQRRLQIQAALADSQICPKRANFVALSQSANRSKP